MSDQSSAPKPFLFIDDSPSYLANITSAFKEMSGGRWLIRTATNQAQALEQLKAQPFHAIVLDVEMPVIDGIQFLRLLGRTHPGQQVVMLSERMDETARKTSLDLGAALFLEKPVSPDGFRTLFAALDTLAGAPPRSGFRGLMQVSLEDVLQMECLARKSCVLVISTGSRQGQIYISDGEIIHAQSGQLQGEMALYGLLALTGGEFNLQPFKEPPSRSITGNYQFLLMEAARLRDEAGSEETTAKASRRAAIELAGDSSEMPVATEACGVRVEEVLLCSGADEVLYDSKCEAIEERLQLMKQLEQQVLEASKGTPSGRFHRVTMSTGNSRFLVRIQPTFKLLVRSALPLPSTNE